MGKRIFADYNLSQEINNSYEFENIIKAIIGNLKLDKVTYAGNSVIIRQCMLGNNVGPEVQVVFQYKSPSTLLISTEYGYRGSGDSNQDDAALLQSQFIERIQKYDESFKKDHITEKETIKDIPSQIIELKNLLDQGVITEEEFVAFKKKLLDSIN